MNKWCELSRPSRFRLEHKIHRPKTKVCSLKTTRHIIMRRRVRNTVRERRSVRRREIVKFTIYCGVVVQSSSVDFSSIVVCLSNPDAKNYRRVFGLIRGRETVFFCWVSTKVKIIQIYRTMFAVKRYILLPIKCRINQKLY